MPGDAIVLFHPRDPKQLEPFLDLDEESEESEGLYAEALEDGTYLVHTFQPFDAFVEDPDTVGEWLEQFGEALPALHDDPRGFLFFPDTIEPEATTYEALVTELEEHGAFFSADDDDGDAGFDLGALESLAQQLLAGQEGAAPGTSFEIGKLFQDMQQQIASTLGAAPEPGTKDDDEKKPGES